MTSRDFCYWFIGYLEISGASDASNVLGISPKQLEVVCRHLDMVFITEIDPSFKPEITPALDAAHDGIQKPTYPMGGIIMRC